MLVEDATLVRAYEELGMTVEQIAEDRTLEVFAVKAKLMQLSAKYRKDCRNEPEYQDKLNFADDELIEANEMILRTMRNATTVDGEVDWRLRSEMAKYVRDDKKGRKDINKAVSGNTFNILTLNESILKARELRNAKEQKALPSAKQAIEV